MGGRGGPVYVKLTPHTHTHTHTQHDKRMHAAAYSGVRGVTPPPTPPPMQRDKRMQLTWACEEQLFRQEMENADDVRLSVRLFAKCLPDKRRVRGGGGGRSVRMCGQRLTQRAPLCQVPARQAQGERGG